jgi:alcohol dehydrogenase class IV
MTLELGLIGCGALGRTHAQCVSRIPGARFTAYADIAEAMGEITTGLSVLDAAYLTAKAAKRLNDDLKIPNLRGLAVEEGRFQSVVNQMALDALASGSPGNNPRKATKEEIVELYRKAF